MVAVMRAAAGAVELRVAEGVVVVWVRLRAARALMSPHSARTSCRTARKGTEAKL